MKKDSRKKSIYWRALWFPAIILLSSLTVHVIDLLRGRQGFLQLGWDLILYLVLSYLFALLVLKLKLID